MGKVVLVRTDPETAGCVEQSNEKALENTRVEKARFIWGSGSRRFEDLTELEKDQLLKVLAIKAGLVDPD